jgi:3,4-dihydroxy-2-butanone 4-phosphate synthase/GTP cyclohydrolase II
MSSRTGRSVRRLASTRLPTRWGTFQAIAFERDRLDEPARTESAVALVMGDLTEGVPLLRIHSQCVTSEVFGSLRCDCAQQLDIAMRAIGDAGHGLVIYEHQEGRGIGLAAKLRAYSLQDYGFDTVDANEALGYLADPRDFALPCAIARELGVRRVRLLSNNPAKVQALTDAGVDVAACLPCEAEASEYSLPYLRTKQQRMGHTLALVPPAGRGPVGGSPTFARIDAAVRELRAGRMIVVVDDEDRENEGDLMMAAEMITPEAVNFMATRARGLICLALPPRRIDELQLAPMTPDNTALGGCAFTVSIDAKMAGVTTGISAADRAATIRAAVDSRSAPDDFARPGHVFPLCARPGGVMERRGHTEAAVDLATLSGLQPAGVICEIVNDNGTMARVPDLVRFCRQHRLVMITVAEIARYRFEVECQETLAAVAS